MVTRWLVQLVQRSLKPIYLLADSRLLFRSGSARPICRRIRDDLEADRPLAAYVGAANGDDPVFFELFCSAMSAIDIVDCSMIKSCFAAEDAEHLAAADVILLAGGDLGRGWRIIDAVGMRQSIMEAYMRGALLVGVSAGAVHLGLGGYEPAASREFVNTFSLVPFIIGVHEEREDWHDLRKAVRREGGSAIGIGLPAGGGMIYHPDRTIEPLHGQLLEFSLVADELKCDVLLSRSEVSGTGAS